MIDLEARTCGKRGMTKARINCSIGHNPCGQRENLIDESKSIDCPRCSMKETWFHVTQCPATWEKNKRFLEMARKEIGKVVVSEECRRMALIEDIENAIYGRNCYKTMQQVIGIEAVFRGFVVIDWFGVDLKSERYKNLNKKIVTLCMQHYWECWEKRNEIRMRPDVRREYMRKWHDRLVEKAKFHSSENVRIYVREYETRLENRSTDSIQRWLIGLTKVIKWAKDFGSEDIGRYMR